MRAIRLQARRDYTLAIELDTPGGTNGENDPEFGSPGVVQFAGQITLDLYGRVQSVPYQDGRLGFPG